MYSTQPVPLPLVSLLVSCWNWNPALCQSLVPLAWTLLTAFKSPPDSIAYPPRVIFGPTLDGYCNLFTTISRQTPEYIASLPPPATVCDRLARARNMVVAGPSNFLPRFANSILIAFGATAL